MKKLLLVLLPVLMLLSCSEVNIYDFAIENGRYAPVAYAGGIPFKSLQAAIEYVCSNQGSKAVSSEHRIRLIKDCTGSGLVIPADYDGDIEIDLEGYTYSFTDKTETGIQVLGGSEVSIKNGTIEVRSSNTAMDYIYRIASILDQDNVNVVDRRSSTKHGHEFFVASGSKVVFSDSNIVESEISVEGFISGEGNVTVKGGIYKFYGIEGSLTVDHDAEHQDSSELLISCTLEEKVLNAVGNSLSIIDVEVFDAEHVHSYHQFSSSGSLYGLNNRSCTTYEYKFCTECGCGHIEKVITNHTPSEVWTTNKEAHWHVCLVCGEVVDVIEHHTEEKVGENGNTVVYCSVCNCKINETVVPDTGITYFFEEQNPMAGTVLKEKADDGSWKLTLINQNDEKRPTSVKWYVDDVLEHSETSEAGMTTASYRFEIPGWKMYHIRCEFSNGSEGSSYTVIICSWD